MITKEFEIVRTATLTYDPASPEFIEALESYREVITGNPETTAEEMVKSVAYSLTGFNDVSHMVEGVGYVALSGNKPPKENWSGIYIKNDFDEQYDA